MRRSKSLGFCAALAVAAGCLWAQDGEPPAGGGRGGRGGRGSTRDFLGLGPAPDAAAAARGEKLYAPNCAFCHGEKARGAEGPNLIRSVVVLDDEKGELIGALIRKGRPSDGMPAFPNFSDAELHDIAQFLHLQVELVANRGTLQAAQRGHRRRRGRRGLFQRRRAAARTATRPPATWPISAPATSPISCRRASSGRAAADEAARAQKGHRHAGQSGRPISGTLKRHRRFRHLPLRCAGNYRSWPRQAVKVTIGG